VGSALSFPASTTNRSGPGDGLLLLAGGTGQRSGELFGFATVKTDKEDYAPGTTVTITGSGWQPGESVALVLVEQPLLDTHPLVNVTADGDGNIVSTEFVPDEHDANIRFILTAYGTASQAQTTFTDAPPARIFFATSGLPSTPATSISVSYSGFNNGGNPISGPMSFTVPGPSGAVNVDPGSQFTYAFPSTVTVAGTSYTLSLASPSSPLTSGASSSNTTVTGTYIVSCTAASVTTQPSNQSVTYGAASVAFVAAATGTPSPTVQWQVSTNGGGSWSDVVGATSTTLAISNPAVSQSGNQYHAVFTNICGGTQTATSSAATLTVNRRAVTLTGTRPYDGTTNAAFGILSVANKIGTDDVTLASGSGTLASKDLGPQGISSFGTLALGGTDGGNYTLTGATGTVTITAVAVNLTGTRPYDGTTGVAFGILSVTNKVGSEDVIVASGSGTLASKNAGPQAISSFGTLALGGTDGGNYTLTGATGTVTITALPVNLTGTRPYDGTTGAAFGILSVANKIGTDAVTVASGNGTLASKEIGARAISAFGSLALGGADGGNYTLTGATGTVTITALAVNLTGTRPYDGTTDAAFDILSVTNTVGAEVVTVASGSGTLASKDVGVRAIVNFGTLTLGGADAGNYTLVGGTGTVTITAWTLKGFYQPVDMGGAYNTVKSGSTVPLKFEVFAGPTELSDVGAIKSFGYVEFNCGAGVPEDPLEELAPTGATVLRYDSTGGQFIYNWKTPAGKQGRCFQVTMTTQDQSALIAYFKMK
jgi:YDG domain